MFRNVHIKGIGTYNPKKVVDNQYYIDHFKKYNLHEHVEGMMNKIGREKRRLAERNENSITMGVNAARKAIKNAGISPGEIDMIICATDTPEYLTPCCALIIGNQIKAENVSNVFDVNNDCIGMITAMDIATRYMKTDKKYKKTLVVGALHISPFAREDDIVVYSCIADGAAAVVLEIREENVERGFLGSRTYTDDRYNEEIRFPACGLSGIASEDISAYNKKMEWKPFDLSFIPDVFTEIISDLLKDNGYTTGDVKHYFLSQFTRPAIEETVEKLGASMENATFVADKYGYTGCTSPVMALNEKLLKDKFMQDDIITFCSIGGGITFSALLYKW